MESEDMTVLVSIKDGTKVYIFTKSARLSALLKFLIDEYKQTELIIPEVKGEQLKQIAEFLNHYKNEEPKQVEKPLRSYSIEEIYGKWESDYISQVINNKQAIFELLEAADYFDCNSLLEFVSSCIACHIKDFNEKLFLDYFGIEEDMTDDDIKKMENNYDMEREIEREL